MSPWIDATGQRWKLRVARACLPVGLLGVGLVLVLLNRDDSAGAISGNILFLLLCLSLVVGLFGSWFLGLLLVCGVCGYRPYLHNPILTSDQVLALAMCPVCAKGQQGSHSTTPTRYWTGLKLVLVLVALAFFLWYLPDAVMRRGIR